MASLTTTVLDRTPPMASPRLGDRLRASHAVGASRRSRVLALRTVTWLCQNLAEPPSIAALCAALGASERTLHEAFREHLDTTPKAYLKTLRLEAARHDLLTGEVKRVTDVALDWGFLHFGWFSHDYRRLFGETPSQTLKRSRGAAPAPFRRPQAWNAPERLGNACVTP